LLGINPSYPVLVFDNAFFDENFLSPIAFILLEKAPPLFCFSRVGVIGDIGETDVNVFDEVAATVLNPKLLMEGANVDASSQLGLSDT